MTHEGLADEDGIGSGIKDALGIVGSFEAGFGHEEDFIGDFVGEFFGGGEVGGEGFEIPIVDPDEIGAEVESAFHFGEVVDFDEDIELDFTGDVVKAAEGVVTEGGDDEEDGIGSGNAGFVDLAFVNGEVFAEEGNGREA